MSLPPHLRRLLVVLGAVGSVLPGVTAGPPPSPTTTTTSAGAGANAGAPRAPSAREEAAPGPEGPVAATPDGLRRTWSWPLAPRPAVQAPFVAPRSTWGAGHRGIDLAASQGQRVLAVDAGVVTHVGVIAGRGTVSVTHASGLRSTYEPVNGSLTVGSPVRAGQVLGTVRGRTHCGGSCLHLGALIGSRYVDPRPLLRGGPVILLPLGAGPG